MRTTNKELQSKLTTIENKISKLKNIISKFERKTYITANNPKFFVSQLRRLYAIDMIYFEERLSITMHDDFILEVVEEVKEEPKQTPEQLREQIKKDILSRNNVLLNGKTIEFFPHNGMLYYDNNSFFTVEHLFFEYSIFANDNSFTYENNNIALEKKINNE